MTPHDAARVLSLLRGSWPRLAPDEVADRLWLEDLIGLELEPALDAFRGLRDTEEFAPSWALFREAYTTRSRKYELQAPALTAPKRVPDAESQALVRDLVGVLKDTLVAVEDDQREGFRQKIDAYRGSGFDPLTPMLGYDEVYGPPAEPTPERFS